MSKPSSSFPPGSLGAQQAGCTCDSPEAMHPLCPHHGLAATLARQVDEIEHERWKAHKARAARRMRWAFPVSVGVSFALSMAASAASEMVARSFIIGFAVSLVAVWLVWNKP